MKNLINNDNLFKYKKLKCQVCVKFILEELENLSSESTENTAFLFLDKNMQKIEKTLIFQHFLGFSLEAIVRSSELCNSLVSCIYVTKKFRFNTILTQ